MLDENIKRAIEFVKDEIKLLEWIVADKIPIELVIQGLKNKVAQYEKEGF